MARHGRGELLGAGVADRRLRLIPFAVTIPEPQQDRHLAERLVPGFMDISHGRSAQNMTDIYRALQSRARFWESAWERRPSKVRGPGYGYSGGKRPVGRRDMTLEQPALPKVPDLALEPVFGLRYAKLLAGPAGALDRLLAAHRLVAGQVRRRGVVLQQLTGTSEKSRLPRNAPVGGRKSLHVMDDVKDHFADRRTGLSHMAAPERSIELKAWCDKLGETIRSYARSRSLPVEALPQPPMND